MVRNATILRIDAQTGMTAGGKPTWTQGAALSVRCGLGQPSQKDLYRDPGLSQVKAAKLMVKRSDLDPALLRAGYTITVANEQRVLVKNDKSAGGVLYRVRSTNAPPAGSASIYELMLVQD